MFIKNQLIYEINEINLINEINEINENIKIKWNLIIRLNGKIIQ